MKVLIAGATGVIGRPVVRMLLGRGHEVRGLARSSANEEALRRLGAEPVRGDLFDPPSLEAAARGCQGVLNLATAIPRSSRPRLDDFALNDRIRTEGTRHLLAAALSARVRRYVQQSVAFFHQSAGEEWVDEDSPIGDHPLAAAIIEMERLVWQSQGLDGLSTVILRGGMLYGPDSIHTRRLFAALRTGLLPVIGAGANYWSLIHTDDMAAACVASIEAERPAQVYLAVDDLPVSAREFMEHVARAQGRRHPRALPSWLVSLLSGPLQTEMMKASSRCRNTRLRRELDWKPIYPTHREGVEAILRAWNGAPARPV